MPQYPCLVCGKPSPRSYCPQHLREQNQDIRSSRAWRQLSERVRAREPHCRDCRDQGMLKLATQVHHSRPRGEGGQLLPPIDELVPLCTAHHNARRRAQAGGLLPPSSDVLRNDTGRPERVTDWPLIG